MREFAHFRGPFTGWSEEQRRSLLGSCVNAINSTNAVAVGAAMSINDFNKLSHEEKSKLQDPFFCCFQEVVRGAALTARFTSECHKVQIIFSQQDEFRAKALKLWGVMACESDAGAQIGSLNFKDMRAVSALQAADLLAYELRHFYHLQRMKPGTPTRWAFREIVTHQRIHQNYMLKYLPNWYLQAQANTKHNEIIKQKLMEPDDTLFQEMTPQIL